MTNRHDVDDLLSELRAALDVEPSRGFEAGVRQRVANERASATRWWWISAAAAVASAAVVVTMVMPRSRNVDDRKPMPVARVEHAAVPPASSIEVATPVAPAIAERTGAVARPSARQDAVRAMRLRNPQSLLDVPVIVPAGQEEALQRLVAALWNGDVAATLRFDESSSKIEILAIQQPEPIRLSAIRIEPISWEYQ